MEEIYAINSQNIITRATNRKRRDRNCSSTYWGVPGTAGKQEVKNSSAPSSSSGYCVFCIYYIHKWTNRQGIPLLKNCCCQYFLPLDWPAVMENQKEDKHELPGAGPAVSLLMTNRSGPLQVLEYVQGCAENFWGQRWANFTAARCLHPKEPYHLCLSAPSSWGEISLNKQTVKQGCVCTLD